MSGESYASGLNRYHILNLLQEQRKIPMTNTLPDYISLPCVFCIHENVCKNKDFAIKFFTELNKVSRWDYPHLSFDWPDDIKLSITCKYID